MADLRTTVAAGVGWTAAQKWLVRLTGMLTFIVLSRLLAPAEIGLVALALAFLGVLGVVADLGTGAFLVQTPSWDEPTRSTAFWTSLTLSIMATALVVAGAGPTAGLLGQPGLAPVLRALAPVLIVSASTAVPSAILQRELRFRELALRDMAAALVSGAVGVALALAGAGVWALVAQTGAQALISAALVWRMCPWRPTWMLSRAAFDELRRFGGPVLAVNVMQSIRDRLEQFLLGALVGVSALGYWTVAVRLLGLLVDVSVAVLDNVALPVFAATRSSAERFGRAFESALASTQVLLVPVLTLVAVSSPAVLPWMFGQQWTPAVAPAQVLCLAYGIAGLTYFNRAALLAHGRSGTECLLTAASLVIHVVLILAVAPAGLVALAWAFTAEAVVTLLLGGIVLHRRLGLGSGTLRRSARVVLVGAGATLVGLATEHVAGLGPRTGALVGATLAAVLLGVALWWTDERLLRQLAGDVRRLLRPQAA